jgi:hypothetical protein
MLLSCHQNADQNQDIQIANRLSERVVTIQIFGNDSNNSKFDSRGNLEEIEFWQCLLPFGPEPSVFSFAVENVKIRIYKTIILPVVLYGCET